MRPDVALDELLDPEGTVNFDLDGDGTMEAWPWVKPDTGFLVWDPGRKGEVTSGRQLFGSYTFQIPWNDGYEPLALLDPNTDGNLPGAELDGIRAWFDRDSDGVSSKSEVVDLAELGIAAIGVNADHSKSGPVCEHGLRLESGKALVTWDWLAKPK